MAKRKSRKDSKKTSEAGPEDNETQRISVPTESQLATKRTVVSDKEAEDHEHVFSDVGDLSDKEKEEIAKFVGDEIGGVEKSSAWDSHLKMIEYSWDSYEQTALSRTLPWKDAPNVRVDLEPSIVDGYVARQLAGNFDVAPYVSIEGAYDGEDVSRAPKIEQFMQYWHAKKMDLYGIAETGFQRKGVVGHHVTKLVYNCDIERVKKTRDMAVFKRRKGETEYVGRGQLGALQRIMKDGYEPTGEIKKMIVDENVYRHVGPKLVTVPETDYVFPIESTPSDGKPAWEAHRMWYKADDIIREIAQKFFFKDCWEKIKRIGAQKRNVLERATVKKDPETGQTISTGDFAIHQWYGKYRRKVDPYARTYLFSVHVESGTLCRAQYHPYDHGDSIFHHNRLFHGRGFWGYGVPWAIRHMSWTCSEMLNQMLAGGFLANSLNFKYKKRKFDPSNTTFMPGKGVGVDSMDDIEEFNIGGRRVLMDITLFRTLREMAESRVSHGKLQSGQPDAKQRTARGVMALLKEGAVMFDRTIKSDQRWIEGVVSQEVQLFQQFLPLEGIKYKNPTDAVGRLFNKDVAQEDLFGKMSREEIQGQYDYVPMGSSNAAQKELDLQLNAYLYGVLKDNLVVKNFPGSYYDITKGLVDASRKKTKILPTKEEWMAKIQQDQQQQAASDDQRNQAVEHLRQQGATDQEIEQVLKNMGAAAPEAQPEQAGGQQMDSMEGL